MKNALEGLRKAYISLFASPYAIFSVGLVILILPYFFRGFALHGQESYFFKRISEFILENNIPDYDFLSFGGRAFFYSMGAPLSLVIANLLFKINITNLLVFTPTIFGFLSLAFFYLILRNFNVKKNTLSFACYMLVLSPPFLYSLTHFTSFTIPLFLNLLGFYFIINEKKKINHIAVAVYFLLTFFDAVHILFGLLLSLFYFYKTKNLKRFIPYSFVLLFAMYLNNHFMKYGLDITNHRFYEYFFTFGGVYGLSIFLLFLSFFGLIWLWKRKYNNLIYYIFLISSLVILLLNIKYLVYFNMALCILGAYGLKYIYKFRWSSTIIRNLTVMLLIGGILFSGVSFLIENFKQDPSDELNDTLDYLEKKTSPRDVILTHEKYGMYINSISKRKNFVDFNKVYAPGSKLRFFYMEKVFHSRRLDELLNLVRNNRVSYILITPEMKNGLVWNKDNEGLLYVIKKNPDYFNLVYDKDGYEIWRIL